MVLSAVRTTGIYCRPGCGARPRADNVRTFEMAAAAEASGYRACLRCRPYRTASAIPADSPELVCRAVQLIIAGVLDSGGEAELGARLAISPRHLRRLFDRHLGTTPAQFARSRRAHFARRLLDDTDLTVIEIAFASGFGSLRQFNRTMREVFRAAPNELRARRRRGDRLMADGGLVLRLPIAGPYDWSSTLARLAERAVPGVESVVDDVYRRTISLDGAAGVLEIGAGDRDHLLLRAHLPYWEGLIHIVGRAASIAGLSDNPAAGHAMRAADPHLGPLARRSPGLRIPGAWSGFEAACAEIAGPDIAVLVQRHGVAVPGLGHGLTHLFPSAQSLSAADQPAIRSLARALVTGVGILDSFSTAAQLVTVVPEAAQRIALRLGSRDAFPSDEPRLSQAIDRLGIPPDASTRWRPWRGLAAIHLIHHGATITASATE